VQAALAQTSGKSPYRDWTVELMSAAALNRCVTLVVAWPWR
jgi:hypothetical protein